MRKRILLLSVLVLSLLMLASCASSVQISTMVPSQVDLTGYSSIKIEEPTVRGVFFSYDKEKIVSKTKDMLAKALSKGPYTVVLSGKSDAVISTDIVIDTGRGFVSVEKSSEKDKNGNPIYRFYMNQSATFSMTYYLRDFKTGAIIDTYTARVGMPSYGYETTFLGESTDPDDSDFRHYSISLYDYIGGYGEAIDSLEKTIINRLVPHTKTVSISLMDNKPEVKALKGAYDAVNEGLYREALISFDQFWQTSGYVQAGYNSAVLYYATGYRDTAIARAYEVWAKTGSEKALSLYSKLSGLDADNEKAKSQSGLK